MNEDPTKQLPKEDRLDPLIAVVHQIASDVRDLTKGQQDLRNEFEALRQFVDERLHDTRPMWQRMEGQISELSTNMETGFRKLNHKFDMLNGHFSDLFADQRILTTRVDALENPTVKPRG